jgi:hypothetical protein
MAYQLIQSVAATIVAKGYLATDHVTAATGFDPAIVISKNAGNFANPAAGASVMTEIQTTGWYSFALGAGDTGTVGPLIIRATHATMDDIEIVCQVVAANVVDNAAIADAVWNEAIADHAVSTTFGGKNQKAVPSEAIDDYKVTGFSTHSPADVWAVATRLLTAGTNIILAKGAGVTGFNDVSSAEVQTACDASLDTAFTDATVLTTNGFKERIRTLLWILRNKVTIVDASGNTTIYKDDSITPALTVAAALTDNGTTTTRKRME